MDQYKFQADDKCAKVMAADLRPFYTICVFAQTAPQCMLEGLKTEFLLFRPSIHLFFPSHTDATREPWTGSFWLFLSQTWRLKVTPLLQTTCSIWQDWLGQEVFLNLSLNYHTPDRSSCDVVPLFRVFTTVCHFVAFKLIFCFFFFVFFNIISYL